MTWRPLHVFLTGLLPRMIMSLDIVLGPLVYMTRHGSQRLVGA